MSILLAEDDLLSQQLLESLLTRWNYEVSVHNDGASALSELRQPGPPRIVILDWMMPGMDGIEVCRLLRAEQRPHYVIMLTYRNQTDDLITALDAGADDFVNKPFHPGELKARLGVGNRIVELERQLEQKNRDLLLETQELHELVEERAQQMVHADRMATLGQLAAGVAHELNNPLTFIAGNIQTLELYWRRSTEHGVFNQAPDEYHQYFQDIPDVIADMRKGIDRVSNIITGLRSYARRGTKTSSRCRIDVCLEQAEGLCRNRLKRGLHITHHIDEAIPALLGDETQLIQVLVNLLNNAVDAVEKVPAPTITISIRQQDRELVCDISDNGHGIDPLQLDHIFEPFVTSKEQGRGTGLGLSIVKRIVEEHGGSIRCRNQATGGACFSVRLPLPDTGPAS
jgi:two-component system, NtrC family, sensor kinase